LVVVCVVGLGLVTGSTETKWEVGVFYTLLCAFFAALHTYVLSDYASESNALVLTLTQLVIVSVIAAVGTITSHGSLYVTASPMIWGAVAMSAVLCTAIAFGMKTYAQRYISSFKAALILTLEPIFATLFAWATLGEVLRPQFYLGACLILGAILLMNIRLKNI